MSPVIQTLDIRVIPIREKHPAIFRLFDALSAGESFQIVNDHDPAPLFYQFQAVRPRQFGWQMIEAGPEVWRVNISKI